MATTPPSQFATLLRRSKFASFDPHISQVYTTFDGNAARGNFGLKRPLALRRRNAFITVQAVDSREQQTVWKSADKDARWIKMWDEVGVTPKIARGQAWNRMVGSMSLEVSFPVDTEFAPSEMVAGEISVDGQTEVEARQAEDTRDEEVVREVEAARDEVFSPPKSQAIPNFESMSDRDFERYLEQLRKLRPAFHEYLKRKSASKSRSQTLLQQSITAGDEYRDFLQSHAYEQYHAPRPRNIEQQPHRHAGLTYTHAPSIQTVYTTAPHPGRVIAEVTPRHGVAYNQVTTAGTVTRMPNGQRGTDDAKVFPVRFTRAALAQPPQAVGPKPEGIESVKMYFDTRAEAESAHIKQFPYTPGSREYVGGYATSADTAWQSKTPTPDITSSSNVPEPMLTPREDVEARSTHSLLAALGSFQNNAPSELPE